MKTSQFSSVLSIVVLLAALVLTAACEEGIHEPINQDSEAPFPVQNPEVQNFSGGARINYTLPSDKKGLLYVKATCEIQPGVIREVKASYYTTELTIDGFGDSLEYAVNLYTVGRNGKESDPVKVMVKPLSPPIWEAFKSLSVKEDWGGINFSFENKEEDDIVFEVLTKDSLGNWESVENFYTKRREAKFSVRGYDAEKRMFGITVRDRWLNQTDTLVGEYTPWAEEALDKSQFKVVNLPTDYTLGHTGTTIQQIMDNVYVGEGWISRPDVSGDLGGGMPQWFTLDLSETAILSRLVVFYRTGDYLYQSGCPKEFEIWGSNNPNPDGSWDDSWVLLRECVAVKPSGLPHGQSTQEDLEYALGGDEFVFEDAPPLRYIRWKTISNQANSTHVNFVELDLYGQYVD